MNDALQRIIAWRGDYLELLDQRRLPAEVAFVQCRDAAEVSAAIRAMVVRGAPAIGITAAYGVVLAAQQRYRQSASAWRDELAADLALLAASRPTAVNLFWALTRMQQVLQAAECEPNDLLAEAVAIHAEDLAANQRMGALGAALIDAGQAVLTHCNTGALATGGYGTALGVIRSAYAAGKLSAVYADETRPWLQGSRLTAWELAADGIPCTLVCEGAAASLLRTGKVGWVIVGADRIAANGDVANKIGTYSLAVLARQHGVKFMVAAPSSTLDAQTASGADIVIEERGGEELLQVAGYQAVMPGVSAWNPVFDVTPASLIDAIVTEKAVLTAPFARGIQPLLEA